MHPEPRKSLVDAAQAISLTELPYFLEDVAIAREAYLRRLALTERVNQSAENTQQQRAA
jgi:3-deoxy-7-phosphoheptulonate synthase